MILPIIKTILPNLLLIALMLGSFRKEISQNDGNDDIAGNYQNDETFTKKNTPVAPQPIREGVQKNWFF